MKQILTLAMAFVVMSCGATADEFEGAEQPVVTAGNDAVEEIPESPVITVPEGMFAYIPNEGVTVLRYGDMATFFFIRDRKQYWEEVQLADLSTNDDGFLEATIMGYDFELILGGNYVELLNADPGEDTGYATWVVRPILEGPETHTMPRFGVASVEGSSMLTEIVDEQQITYAADRLWEFFFWGAMGIDKHWNAEHLPWVEGEEGPGIGVTLDVTFEEPSDHMVILNGFVDPKRRHLFKMNNRVRRAIIRSVDDGGPFSFEQSFNDVVEFTHIPFPRAARSVQLEIREVYPGTRWDDTAITGIVTNHEWEWEHDDIVFLLESKTPETQWVSPE